MWLEGWVRNLKNYIFTEVKYGIVCRLLLVRHRSAWEDSSVTRSHAVLITP